MPPPPPSHWETPCRAKYAKSLSFFGVNAILDPPPQFAVAENGAEHRRRRRTGKTGKNDCGCYKPLSGKLSCRWTPQRWSRQTTHGLGACIGMHLVNGTGNSPVSVTLRLCLHVFHLIWVLGAREGGGAFVVSGTAARSHNMLEMCFALFVKLALDYEAFVT